jgi:hypothetical protein
MRYRHFISGLAVTLIVFIAIVCITGGGFYLFIVRHFQVPPPDLNYPEPTTALEAQKQDLDYFGKLVALDRSYSPEARKRADDQLAELKSLSGSLPTSKLKVDLMAIIALADNGHTMVRWTSGKPPIMVEPVRITPFSDGFYVMRTKQSYSALLGGRVTEIDGISFDQLLARVETLLGGTKAWRRENAASLIDLQDILYGLGIAHDPQVSYWTVLLPDGRSVTALLHSYALGKEPLPVNERWLSPELLKGMSNNWISYRPEYGVVPESLRNYDDHFALIHIPNSCAVDIRLQDITDTDGQKIVPFLQSTESALDARRPCGAIVDLRGDHGGNYANTWHFAHVLPKIVAADGPIYVLTDSQTFSAAITTTAFLKNAGGDRVKIIGEPVGDRLVFYSEGQMACLPTSKICVSYQLGKHDYVHPCMQRDCWWENWFYPVRVKSLQPDVVIPRRFADWNKGYDAAYEWAVQAIQNSTANGSGRVK